MRDGAARAGLKESAAGGRRTLNLSFGRHPYREAAPIRARFRRKLRLVLFRTFGHRISCAAIGRDKSYIRSGLGRSGSLSLTARPSVHGTAPGRAVFRQVCVKMPAPGDETGIGRESMRGRPWNGARLSLSVDPIARNGSKVLFCRCPAAILSTVAGSLARDRPPAHRVNVVKERAVR